MSTDREVYEQAVRDCYSTWGDTYYEEYYTANTAYPPVHADLLRHLLADAGARVVLDAGCGPASFLRDLPEDVDGWGFDLTPEMIESGRRFMSDVDRPADQLWVGSVLDAEAFTPPVETGSAPVFDAAVCIGVLPHVADDADEAVLRNLVGAVRPGGTVVVEARNELFGLFTMNRYTHRLFTERLVPVDRLRAAAGPQDDVGAAFATLEGLFRTDQPPIRIGEDGGTPGYDEVLSRTHNPFELRALAERVGLRDVRVRFYHFHSLPPLAASEAPVAERTVSLQMEADPQDWRGHFMASAFLLSGVTPA